MFCAALADLACRHNNQRRECDYQQSDGGSAVQLLDLAVAVLSHLLIEEGKTYKDKKQMGAEYTERRFAQSEEGFNRDEAAKDGTEPVNYYREGEKIHHAHWA
jgi:hypothetical protein